MPVAILPGRFDCSTDCRSLAGIGRYSEKPSELRASEGQSQSGGTGKAGYEAVWPCTYAAAGPAAAAGGGGHAVACRAYCGKCGHSSHRRGCDRYCDGDHRKSCRRPCRQDCGRYAGGRPDRGRCGCGKARDFLRQRRCVKHTQAVGRIHGAASGGRLCRL